MITLVETETSKWFSEREFRCPTCGSNHFGTSNAHIWEAAIGHCHGHDRHGVACKFTWERWRQDELFFELKEEA